MEELEQQVRVAEREAQQAIDANLHVIIRKQRWKKYAELKSKWVRRQLRRKSGHKKNWLNLNLLKNIFFCCKQKACFKLRCVTRHFRHISTSLFIIPISFCSIFQSLSLTKVLSAHRWGSPKPKPSKKDSAKPRPFPTPVQTNNKHYRINLKDSYNGYY